MFWADASGEDVHSCAGGRDVDRRDGAGCPRWATAAGGSPWARGLCANAARGNVLAMWKGGGHGRKRATPAQQQPGGTSTQRTTAGEDATSAVTVSTQSLQGRWGFGRPGRRVGRTYSGPGASSGVKPRVCPRRTTAARARRGQTNGQKKTGKERQRPEASGTGAGKEGWKETRRWERGSVGVWWQRAELRAACEEREGTRAKGRASTLTHWQIGRCGLGNITAVERLEKAHTHAPRSRASLPVAPALQEDREDRGRPALGSGGRAGLAGVTNESGRDSRVAGPGREPRQTPRL